jgi:hypothetical protein
MSLSLDIPEKGYGFLNFFHFLGGGFEILYFGS